MNTLIDFAIKVKEIKRTWEGESHEKIVQVVDYSKPMAILTSLA